MTRSLLALLLVVGLAVPAAAPACTNLLVSRGASADGSTMISYTADSHELYGELVLRPAGVFPPGTMRDVIEWDTNKFLGRIPQAARTFRVVGNMNEKQVAIGETTFTGRDSLRDPKAVLDYGSLMFIALERAATAREAIRVMTTLVAEHGYDSTGESFSISDPDEVWLLEMIGKGPEQKGAVWVARRVPDGYISGHANWPRIRQFPLKDPANCLYAPDVISLRPRQGLVRRPRRGLLLRRHLRAAHRQQAAQLRITGVEPVPPRRALAGADQRHGGRQHPQEAAAAVGQARPQALGAGRAWR